MMNGISIAGDSMIAQFSAFGPAEYELFLRCKKLPESTLQYDYADDCYKLEAPARYASLLGMELAPPPASDLEFSGWLFQHQTAIAQLALSAKRFAVWSDCGTGKTNIFLEYARHVIDRTKGRVMIMTLADLIGQTIDEKRTFFGEQMPIEVLESRADMRKWCKGGGSGLAITNYEKMNPDADGQIVNELRHLDGLIIDESSRLKGSGGKQKWALIKSSKGIPYKLSCTATPAPNDVIEFASQASFLERMRNENEIIWTFFARDPKTQEWTVKRHARTAFFEWMAGWSIYLRDPRRYGWSMDIEPPPEPEILKHSLDITEAQVEAMAVYNTTSDGQMSLIPTERQGIVGRSKLSQIAKGFVYEKIERRQTVRPIESVKPEFIADLVTSELARGLQVLVWTVFDEESEIIGRLLRDRGIEIDVLSGKTKKDYRAAILDDFRAGRKSGLVSKASLLGYGQNFQMCGSMIFSGWDDSFERFYQAVRRAVRYGQTKRVRIHLPYIPELEGAQLDNIFRKQLHFEEAIEEQETAYIAAMQRLRLTEVAA